MVIDLFRHLGIFQAEAETMLGVFERTVRRRSVAARLNLHRALGGKRPGS